MPQVIILYDSRGGNTRKAAEAIAEGVGLVPHCQARLMSAEELEMPALEAAGALAVGSPNYYSYPSGRIKTFFDLAYRNPAFKGKRFAAFSTHAGGGGISQCIEKLGNWLGMVKLSDGIDTIGSPVGDDLNQLRHVGQVLARAAANAVGSTEESA
jgi:flavodoxin